MMHSFEVDGFAVVPEVLSVSCVTKILEVIEPYCYSTANKSGRPVHALRNLFDVLPGLSDLQTKPEVRALVEPILGPMASAVRTIYFDKQPGANWKVPWHQDQAIAVQTRIDVPGFGPWSVKNGIHHVEPPLQVLEQMLTVRLHLDTCGKENGPLRVIPGTHKLGRIATEDAGRLKKNRGEATCTVDIGGAVLMRPLLLHASSPSVVPDHRRVIHMEFASVDLPGELAWAEQTALVGRQQPLA